MRRDYRKGETVDVKRSDGVYITETLNLTKARIATAALKAERQWINTSIEDLSSVTIELVEAKADYWRATAPETDHVGWGRTPVEALADLRDLVREGV